MILPHLTIMCGCEDTSPDQSSLLFSFDVQFTVNRHPLRLMYRALGLLVQETAPLKLYFPVAGSKPDTKKTTIEVRKFYNRNIETNQEQV